MSKRTKFKPETTLGIDELSSIIRFISDQQTFFYLLESSELITDFVRNRWIECNVTFNLKILPTEPLHYVNKLNINFRCSVYFWYINAENGCIEEKFPNLQNLIIDGSQNEFTPYLVSTGIFYDTVFPTSEKVVHLQFKNITLDKGLYSYFTRVIRKTEIIERNRNGLKSLKLKNVKPHKLYDVDLSFIDSFDVERLKIYKTNFKINRFPQSLSRLSIDLRQIKEHSKIFEQVNRLSKLKSISLYLSLDQCNVILNSKTLENVKFFCDSSNGSTFLKRFEFENTLGDLPNIRILRLCFSLFKQRKCACISETYLLSDRVVRDEYISKCEIDNAERNGVSPQNMDFVKTLKARVGLNNILFVVNNIYNGSYLYKS